MSNIPRLMALNNKYAIREWRHALSILDRDFSKQFLEIIDVLEGFELKRSEILAAGGAKSKISDGIDGVLYSKGWSEKAFSISTIIDGTTHAMPTHKIDCVSSGVALDIEWNNKTEFYDRDLNNFRLLHKHSAISVGVIITRSTELQAAVFNPLGVGKKYGASTTHFDKLLPKIEGGGAEGCPLLVISILPGAYVKD